jgi:sigma-B regulation protein RsbU (phosphoserine phosphatase)
MGKGVGAGMIAAAVRSVIRSSSDDADPAVALRRATTGLAAGDSGADVRFTTCFHARITPTGTIRWADAGHGLAFIRRADGEVEHLQASDLPVGLGDEWTSHTQQLEAGDTLVCVSDGVLDLFDDDLVAIRRFTELLASTGIPSEIIRKLMELTNAEEQADDVTVIAASFAPVLIAA